jgi:hypothetical protein
VQGDGSITHEQVDELGDEFLRVLVGAIDVVPAGDDEGQVEGAGVGLSDELGTGLGGGVGVGGLEGGGGGEGGRGGAGGRKRKQGSNKYINI